MSRKTYSEMLELPTFEERYEYLKLGGGFGVETYGSSRYLKQRFYMSSEWKDVRNEVIIRDGGCDLAIPELEIFSGIYVHHIQPLTRELVYNHDRLIFDPENLVCVTYNTHKAIHYGDAFMLADAKPIERRPNDTCPWKGGTSGRNQVDTGHPRFR
jgi:hypothetical protein